MGAFVIYQVIELRISQHAVGRSPENLFDLSICVKAVDGIKSRWAQQYEATYQAILEKIAAGNLVHADETKVTIDGTDRYVWVFTNLEEVAFVYGETREGKTPQEVLCHFRGVLVSDSTLFGKARYQTKRKPQYFAYLWKLTRQRQIDRGGSQAANLWE